MSAHTRHRRLSCDELLAAPSDDSDLDEGPEDFEVPTVDQNATSAQRGDLGIPSHNSLASRALHNSRLLERRAFFVRTLALLCVCSLSVGSHYASYILGPLKSRLSREIGTSHTDFSLLISAFSLNSTWTPLVGGVLASTLGTTYTSILATGVIFFGQCLLLLGDLWGNVRLMVFGLFIFGLGVSPLAVVQETIIVRFFKSHGLGVSMAFGLIAGKGASFVSARTSYPLSEKFGPRAPFYVATFLAGMSVVVNLIYIAASKWLVDEAGAELEAADISEEAQRRSISNITEAQALDKVAAKRRVNIRQIAKLGDVFWAYIGLNVLCGMIWAPFIHLAANIIEVRYGMTEKQAAKQASYLLVGSLFLYPICGFLVDRFKHQPIVVRLLLLSSSLTISAYTWLALPPSWTQSPTPAIVTFGMGHGFSPLLLVVLVPKIVPLKYVSTALGAHKSLEQTGSTIFQTLAGLTLDIRKGTDKNEKASKTALQHLLNVLLLLNVLQLLSILGVAYLQQKRTRYISRVSKPSSPEIQHTSPQMHRGEDRRPLLDQSQLRHSYAGQGGPQDALRDERGPKSNELRRGEAFVSLCAASIGFTWILFLGTAWFRLGKGRL